MTPRKARRIAVYSTGLNRAWGVTRTLKRTGFVVWGAATFALYVTAAKPPKVQVVREIERVPFAKLDLVECRKMVHANRHIDWNNDVMLPAYVPSQHTTLDALENGGGVYNPKDAAVIAAKARIRSQERIARERALDVIIKRRPVVVPKGGMLVR